MSTPTIDVRAALEAAGVRYRRSGRWTRVRAEWRDSRDFNIAIADSGGWHDHATGEHGRWDELAGRLGIYVPTDRAPRAPAPACKSADDSSDRIRRAHAFWRAAGALGADTPAARWARAYLESRGPGILDAAMRAGARARLAWHDGKDQPCVVWPIYDLSHGTLIGVQREWGRGHTNKKMLGRHILDGTSGGFIIPAAGEDSTLYMVEGPVTGCAVAAVTGCAVAVLYDTAGLSALPVALAARHQRIIAADNDKSGAGEKAAVAAARRILLRHPRTRIQITMPPDVGADWADINEQSGPEAVRAALEAGLREPEPPKPPTPGGGVIPLVPWEKTWAPPVDPGMPLAEAEKAVTRAVRRALRLDAPTVIAATMGLGKTKALAREAAGSRQPLLILSRTLDDAQDLMHQIPGAHFHKGRDTQNCFKFGEVDALQTRRRTPYAHLCQTCPHGRTDAEKPCEYMVRLRESVYNRVIIAVHAAGAEDSLLYQYAPDLEQPNTTVERKLVVDECPPVNNTTVVEMTDIAQWRAASASAADAVAGGGDDRASQRARAWVTDMTTQLDALAATLGAAPPQMHPLNLPTFVALAGRIPPSALSVDGTLFERVRRESGRFVIPLKAIATLGQAMAADTCWIEGGRIVALTPATLWTRLVQHGGVLLDATPSLRVRAEVAAFGGEVHTIRAAQPHLRIIQYGPRLHGRGGLTGGGLAREGATVRGLLDADSRAVCITHRPVAAAIDDARCGHWGRDDRAHNRWREAPRLILYGLPLLSPTEQWRQYAADRAALAAVGVEWADWDGTATQGQTVGTNGWRVRSAARLPTEPQARAWVLDRLAADTAQAIGRLRAVRRDEPVTVEIHGLLPLVGHGIRIDEFRHEREGRAADRLKTRAAVAAGVVHLGEHLTRARLSDFVLLHRGVRASNTTLDSMLDEIKSDALTLGTTLEAAVMELITKAEDLLSTHDGDAVQALDEVAGHAPALELLLWACAFEPLADGARAAQGP